MKNFKDYDIVTEGKRASIWNTKPQTSKEAEDPEVYIQGFGRLDYSQMKNQATRAIAEIHNWAKSGDFDIVQNKMANINGMVEGIREIDKEMEKPAWRRKITMLKRAGK